MNKPHLSHKLKEKLLITNPSFIQLFGLCPMLAISDSIINAIGMGIALTMVLAVSNLVIALIHKILPQKVKMLSYIIVVTAFVSLTDMLMKALLPTLSASLGIYIPLIVINCLILVRHTSDKTEEVSFPTVIDGFNTGLSFTFAVFIVAVIREILGSGSLFGLKLFGGIIPFYVFALPSGAFLTLGFVIAFVQRIRNTFALRGEDKE